MILGLVLLAGALSGVEAGLVHIPELRDTATIQTRGADAAADIGCGTKTLDHADFDAARAELEKLCGTGPLPSHQNLFRRHGSAVAFLCSFGNGGNPGDFPKEDNKTCVTPITGACGAYTAGWVIASSLNITYGIDAANTTICNNKP